MKAKNLRFTVVLSAAVLILGFGYFIWTSNSLQALNYDGIHTFRVHKHSVMIETKSFSITEGDNGPAIVIITMDGTKTVLNSQFDNDFFSDVRPAYISWQYIDDDYRRDLLIWKPDMNGRLSMSEYVSSSNGQLHTLTPPMKRSLPTTLQVIW